jgi:hypothetical protein
MKLLHLLLFIILLSSSCESLTPEKIYEKYRSSVVLIKNEFYFVIHFDNGLDFYYTIGPNGQPKLHDNESEALENASTSFGTGFFISDNGEIATNRHVIFPEKSQEKVGEAINKYFYSLRGDLQKAINEKNVESSKIEAYYARYNAYLNFNDVNTLKDAYLEKKNAIVELEELLSTLNFNPNNTEIKMKRKSLGIAYDNTHVTNSKDFIECVPIKKANDENIDLAIIQLKNKKTPVSVKEFISLKDIKKGHKLKLGDDVHMIGFNYGIKLAETSDGIKSQFTSGKITQDPDSKSVLYSIPSLHGSSGSPIINKWGELVAINFAKVSEEQSFNFGIPSSFLKDLHAKTQVESLEDKVSLPSNNTQEDNSNNFNNTSSSPSSTNSIDNKAIIQSMTEAEDSRDFDAIFSHFSPNIVRYWDINNPTYDDLKKRYEYSWRITSDSKNTILRIDKITDNTYDLISSFEYYSNKKQERITKESRVRFIFDNNGKISEVYGL